MIAKVCLFLAVVAAAHATAPLLTVGHLGAVSAQSSAINHIAPVGLAHGIAAAPIAYGMAAGPYGLGAAGYGMGLGHGIAAGNLRADGITGHGILGSRYGSAIAHNAVVGHGLIGGARYGGVYGLGGLGHGLGGLGYGLGGLGNGLGGLGGLGHGVGLGKAIW